MILSDLIFLIFSIFTNFVILRNFNFFKKNIPLYDVPNLKRKIHKKSVPVLGGIWIFFNVFIIILYLSIFNKNLLINFFFFNVRDLFFFLAFLIIFITIGLYDDVKDIKYDYKLFIILFSSFLLFYSNEKLIIYSLRIFFIDQQYNFTTGKYSLLFMTFSFVFLLMSLNMLDGINLNLGLFYFINILLLFFLTKNIIFLYLIVPIIFFLYLNLKSRVFLGDSGAFVISMILMYFFVHYYNQGIVFKTFDKVFVLFLYPIIDFLRVVTARLLNFKNLALGDRNHLHHILHDRYGLNNAITIIVLKHIFVIIMFLFSSSLSAVISYIAIYTFIFFISRLRISIL
jgi:UDP-GlcNAc:undecaprenyl-phosphate GlcNAc-1-phosphate transferase